MSASSLTNAGKARRATRIVDKSTGRIVILPADHALLYGTVAGVADIEPMIRAAGETGTNAVLLRFGEAKRFAPLLHPAVGLFVRISGSTDTGPDRSYDVLMNTVEACAAIGADGVCACLKLGAAQEHQMLRDLAAVGEACERLGMVFLGETFAMTATGDIDTDPYRTAWGARVVQELGADLIKIAYTGSPESLRSVTSQCQVPIVVAGGDAVTPSDFLGMVADALHGGARGVAAGRNVVGAPDPHAMATALSDLVHGRATLVEARAYLQTAHDRNRERDGVAV
jgi:DhnA family fructose-bisphosphate aldolase class Ia